MHQWFKRIVLGLIVLVIIGLIGFFTFAPSILHKARNPIAPHPSYLVTDEIAAFHNSLIIGDLHADPLLWKRDLTHDHAHGQYDIPKAIAGNMAVQIFGTVTKSPAGQNYEDNSADTLDNITLLAIGQLWPVRTWFSLFERADYQAGKLKKFAKHSNGTLRFVTTRSELDAIIEARKSGEKIMAGLMGLEGVHALEGKIENLSALHETGFRVIGLHHFFDNEAGGTLHSPANNGLSPFGAEVVRMVEDKNMVLDLAHSSPQVVHDVLAMTDMPMIVSHTGIHSHTPVTRNIIDTLIKAIAEKGGVVGIGFWADVTGDNSPRGIAHAINHAISVVGEDHVALGSDFDGAVGTSFSVADLAILTQRLSEAGLSDQQIRKVMGENMLRVLRERL